MSDLFAAFGIDWRLLLVNGVNFGLLLLGLWYFLYKPLTSVLEARRQKMAQGVHDAEAAAHELGKIEEARAGLLAQAGKEADEVVSRARALGAEKQRALVEAGEANAATLLTEAEAQAKQLKEETIAQSKQEVAKLIVLGMERVALEGSTSKK